jgi:hypothetical protein
MCQEFLKITQIYIYTEGPRERENTLDENSLENCNPSLISPLNRGVP